jgi:hypothetical protein
MKLMPLVVLLLAVFIPASQGVAETDVRVIDTLIVDLWPDYDKASVLVLLTGTLPVDTPLPARVTLPFPESARLNAVARIDARDGKMKDDILSSPGPGELAFITPDPAFRVEYYLPYTAKDKQRSFDFTWQADLSVTKFRVKVQHPAGAKAFRTDPAKSESVRDENGLNYSIFPVQNLPAGQPFKLHVDYTMDLPRLSVQNPPPPNPGPPPSTVPAKPPAGPGLDWPLLAIIAGCTLMVLAVIWMVVTRRSGSAGTGGR